MPACRIDPPSRCFQRHTSSMKAREPAMTPPIGAPRPFEKSIQAESQPAAMFFADIPVATQAFNKRAPSIWVISPCALRSEEHTSELQSQFHLVCRLLL